jgi:hypothetical protein
MKRHSRVSLSWLLLLQVMFAIDLPVPPQGFSWQEIPELKAAFLKPEGWYFKQEEQKGTLAYFITKENIDKAGGFQTGLTVNVFRNLMQSAVDQAQAIIDRTAANKHGEKWTKEAGPFKEFGCRTKDTDASGTIVMERLAVANPKTNTLYLFIFESPESEWNVSWKMGERIMDMLALDDGT